MPAQLSKYELEREANIAKARTNKALLQSLGLDGPLLEKKEVPRKKAPSKKRKVEAVVAEENDENAPNASVEEPPAKVTKTDASANETGSVRRSSRNAGKKVDYNSELKVEVKTLTQKKNPRERPLGSDIGDKRKHNPKQYGSIPGVEVGTWWQTRAGCSIDAIHAPWVGGISGGKDGAHSVALSGGYDDDVDLGYAFTYTGSGGRDLKGTKAQPKNLRTAPQSSDQTFENTFNKMLLRSCETRNPVRVIRGYKLRSKYAPSEGFRYDGLYIVEKAWIEKGLNPKGYKVCKYAFKRLPNQPPLTVRADDDEQAERAEQEESADEAEDREGQEDEEEDAKDADGAEPEAKEESA